MNKVTLIAFLMPILLGGCSNKPREVEASVELVNNAMKPVGIKLPEQYQQTLDTPSSTTLPHGDYYIELGPNYSSSLGNQCRQLFIHKKDQQTEQRVACANSEQQQEEQVNAWYLVPNIVQSATSIQL